MRVKGFKPQEWLIDNLYQASTLANKNERPYADSNISVEEVKISGLRPTQYYAIGSGVENQWWLRRATLEAGEDTLRMEKGGIIIDEKKGAGVMLPPIVEEYEHEGLLLVDGMHRTTLASCLGMKTILAVVVRDINPKFAVLQRQLPNEWSEVVMFPTLEALKRARQNGFVHRRKGYAPKKKNVAYRDFSSFTGRGKDERK
ncbi:hypothetical protein FBF29_03945 [Candidatus Saccharibacteria bacterium oral taxon 488]|nr:hypothetical protein FBF29_03945 [Candidatus Saccharibacteria bacterium oral taxon 488]